MSITAQEISTKIDEALKMFGEYSYHDKGAREVMDVDEIANELRELTPSEIIAILEEVEKIHPDPDNFLMDCINCFDDDPRIYGEDNTDELFESEIFQEYY